MFSNDSPEILRKFSGFFSGFLDNSLIRHFCAFQYAGKEREFRICKSQKR